MGRTDTCRFGGEGDGKNEGEKKGSFCGENRENKICLGNKTEMKPSKLVLFMHHILIN